MSGAVHAQLGSTAVDATTPSTASSTACSPSSSLCQDGACPVSSCAVIGLGASALSCYNIYMGRKAAQAVPRRLHPASNSTIESLLGSPCVHLACVLDRPNCTTATVSSTAAASINSSAPSSSTGFCTGRVVAAGGVSAADLHPQATTLLGLPCIANEDPVPGLKQRLAALKSLGVQSCSNSPSSCPLAPGIYVQRGWRVCNCKGGMLLSTAVDDLLSAPSL